MVDSAKPVSFNDKTRSIQSLWIRMEGNTQFFFGTSSLLLLIGILIACLAPFHAARNTVSWTPEDHGLTFGRHGIVLGSESLSFRGDRQEVSSSLELWLQPDPQRKYGLILGVL